MKKLVHLFLLLVACGASAQTSYFVDKKGNKTIVRDDAFDVILIDRRITYKLVGKTWEKYVKFEDLDHVKYGPFYMKTFRLNGKKKDMMYFVNLESPTKKLITLAIVYSSTSGTGFTTSFTEYLALVIDNNNMVLEELKFSSSKKDEDKRDMLAPMIRKHFSDCPKAISGITDTTSAMEQIESPHYLTCE